MLGTSKMARDNLNTNCCCRAINAIRRPRTQLLLQGNICSSSNAEEEMDWPSKTRHLMVGSKVSLSQQRDCLTLQRTIAEAAECFYW